jgi:ABC-type phosphate transport system auxiliary subunit
LAKLEKRRTQLADSLDAATHNAIDASAARRDLIIANVEP